MRNGGGNSGSGYWKFHSQMHLWWWCIIVRQKGLLCLTCIMISWCELAWHILVQSIIGHGRNLRQNYHHCNQQTMQHQMWYHYLSVLGSQLNHLQLMGNLRQDSIQLCLTCQLSRQVTKVIMSVSYTDGRIKNRQATIQFPLEHGNMSWDAISAKWIFVFSVGNCTTPKRI